MKTVSVGEFKSKFALVLEWIKNGEEVIISYGRKKKEVAVLMDIAKYNKPGKRKLGLLKGKATARFADTFKMSTEEFLGV